MNTDHDPSADRPTTCGVRGCPDHAHDPAALWFEVPLLLPDWIKIDLTLNIDPTDHAMWGGIRISDGLTDSVLVLTAEPFRHGPAGLEQALDYLRNVALRHLVTGEPFPA